MITAKEGIRSFSLAWTPTNEPDILGYVVCGVAGAGPLTPSAGNVLNIGPETFFTYNTCTTGTWTVKVAAYDTFCDPKNLVLTDLNFSDPVTVNVKANVTYSTTAPSGAVDSDMWVDISTTPLVLKVYSSGSWNPASSYLSTGDIPTSFIKNNAVTQYAVCPLYGPETAGAPGFYNTMASITTSFSAAPQSVMMILNLHIDYLYSVVTALGATSVGIDLLKDGTVVQRMSWGGSTPINSHDPTPYSWSFVDLTPSTSNTYAMAAWIDGVIDDPDGFGHIGIYNGNFSILGAKK